MTGGEAAETAEPLAVGARSLVTLAGLGSAGYHWRAQVDDPKIVSVESVPVERGSEDHLPSESRDEGFALTALAVGEATVNFTQGRSFEPGADARAVRKIQVRVVSDNA